MLELTKLPEFHRIFFSTPTDQELSKFKAWIKTHKDQPIILFHGSPALNPILEKGVLPTTFRRRNSLQSGSGYSYWSLFPGLAESFATYAALNRGANPQGHKHALYQCAFALCELSPDKDQLRNKRMWANIDCGNTLAESLAIGYGARFKGKLPPHRVQLVKTW